MHTFKYKGHYIHENFNSDIIQVQFANNKIITVKSVRAAKILITRHIKAFENELSSWG